MKLMWSLHLHSLGIKPGRTVDYQTRLWNYYVLWKRVNIQCFFFFFILLFDVWTSEIRDTVVFLLQWCDIFLVYFLEGWKVDVLVLQYGIQNSKCNTFLLVLGFFKWYSCHHRYSAELSSMKIALKYNSILLKTYFVAIKGNVIFPLNSDTPDVERGCS